LRSGQHYRVVKGGARNPIFSVLLKKFDGNGPGVSNEKYSFSPQ
jgi:hypothetical protein